MTSFGALIIGDELLSGKRQDKHLAKLIGLLGARGLQLSFAEYLGDDPERITDALRRALASNQIVFSFGGIGATPDDHTRRCAALAAGQTLVRHPEAEAEIIDRFKEEAFPHRVKMADLPSGCRLIPNPYNRVAGFSVGHVHFVPGFPIMAWPMVEWVLDTQYPHLFGSQAVVCDALVLEGVREGQLIDLMEAFVQDFPSVRFSSLPSFGENGTGQPHVELGITGRVEAVEPAFETLKTRLEAAGYGHFQLMERR